MSNIRRTMMAAANRGGSAVDWESIARGMLDGATPFSIPDGVGLIANATNWLWYRANLTSIVFPMTVTSIPNNYCYGCSGLASVTFKGEITTIGQNTFRECLNITEMFFEGSTPPTLSATSGATGSLGNPSLTFPIYVPDNAVNGYKSAQTWVNYASRVKGISERPT